MHHFIYPSKDTYITNETNYLSKNVGIDELLELKANTQLYRTVTIYQTASVSQSYSVATHVYLFSGSFMGYASGSEDITSSLHFDSSADINGSYAFNGVISGSINGNPTTSSVINETGHISGSLSGSLTGSWRGIICATTGSFTLFSGLLQGEVFGTQSVYSPRTAFSNIPDLSRILVKFDINSISSSLLNGNIKDIDSIKFVLNLVATEVSEVPLSYTIYSYPISQSWEMGAGRYETGGTSLGVSWYYKNYAGDSGSYWYPVVSGSTYDFVDYLHTASYASESYEKGGGTWYYNIPNTWTAPSSSRFTSFFNTASLVPTFETQYSSSLQTNLTASFPAILTGSLNSIVNSSSLSNSLASQSYANLYTFATTVYTNTSTSIELYLSNSLSQSAYETEIYQNSATSSALFLTGLSSSILNIITGSLSYTSYTSQSYTYILELSTSVSGSIYQEVYDDINAIYNNIYSSSVSASNKYAYYTAFSSSLNNELTTNYWYTSSVDTGSQSYLTASALNSTFLFYTNETLYPNIYSSSIELINLEFSSSIFTGFSSSFVLYVNNRISEVETSTSQSVAASLTQSYASTFCNTLYTGSSLICSQSFEYTTSDVKMDVTQIVKGWICGCIPNEGFILLSSLELSEAENTTGTIRFFSKDTNTIYTPYLDVYWNDNVYNTGSLVSIQDGTPYVVTVKNLSKNYKFGSMPRINVYARDKNPLKNFVRGYQMNQYLTSSLLPETSYYAIKDNESERIILDFDDATKLSCDGNMHYFVLDTTSFAQERFYRILIKTVTDTETHIFDNGYIFKITR